MNVGLIGLPRSGKTTVFGALTGAAEAPASKPGESHLAVVTVPDPRIDALAEISQSKKKSFATVQYIDLPGVPLEQAEKQGLPEEHLRRLGQVDALLAVVRAFEGAAGLPFDIEGELESLHTELILSDLQVSERRLEKLRKTVPKLAGLERDTQQRELDVLERVEQALSANTAIRELEFNAAEKKITRGFQFLSEKPILYVLNVGEATLAAGEDWRPRLAAWSGRPRAHAGQICAQVELEIGALEDEDRRSFMEDYGLTQPAAERLIQRCYELMNYITFLTTGEKESHAWTIPRGAKAPQAAGAIHSDFERGFIRAEVIRYEELVRLGTFPEARKAGKLRLEGKEYVVEDGDVIEYRFSV